MIFLRCKVSYYFIIQQQAVRGRVMLQVNLKKIIIYKSGASIFQSVNSKSIRNSLSRLPDDPSCIKNSLSRLPDNRSCIRNSLPELQLLQCDSQDSPHKNSKVNFLYKYIKIKISPIPLKTRLSHCNNCSARERFSSKTRVKSTVSDENRYIFVRNYHF